METTKYISFATFIKRNSSHSALVAEGEFVSLLGGKSGSGKSGGFLNMFSWLTSAFGDKKSKLDETIEQCEADAEKAAEKRLKELEESAEAAAVAKIKAKFEEQQRNAELINNSRVDAYNQLKAKYERQATAAKNRGHVLTQEELQGRFERMDKELSALEGTQEYKEAQKLADLTRMALIKPDGSVRTKDELKALVDKTGSLSAEEQEVMDAINSIQSIKKDNEKSLLSAINDTEGDSFQSMVEETVGKYPSAEEVAKREKEINDAKTAHENAKALVKKVEEAKKARKTAQDAHDKAQKALEDHGTKEPISGEKKKEALKTYLSKNTADLNSCYVTNEEGNQVLDKAKFEKYLKNKGVPANLATQIYTKIESSGNVGRDRIGDGLEAALTSSEGYKIDLDEISDKVNKKWSEQKDTLASELDTASDKLSATPDPKDLDSITDQKLKDAVTAYNQMQEDDIKRATEGNPMCQAIENGLQEKTDKVNDEKARMKSQQAANKAKREEAVTRHDAHSIPEELVSAAREEADGVGAGMEKKDGKLGYYNAEGKFIERPENASDKELEKFQKEMEAELIKCSPNAELKKVTQSGGTYYIDGKKIEGNDIEGQVKAALVHNDLQVRRNAAIDKKKRTLADDISKCFKNGELDQDKWNNVVKKYGNVANDAMKNPKDFFGSTDGDDPILIAGVDPTDSEKMSKLTEKIPAGNSNSSNNDETTSTTGGEKESLTDEEKENATLAIEKLGDDNEELTDEDKNLLKKMSKLSPEDQKSILKDQGMSDEDIEDSLDALETIKNKGFDETQEEEEDKSKDPRTLWVPKKLKDGKGVSKKTMQRKGNPDVTISKKEFLMRVRKYQERQGGNTPQESLTHQQSTLLECSFSEYIKRRML